MFTKVITGISLILATMAEPASATVANAGSMVIVGKGPELPAIERLARAFEKGHIGSVVDIQWHQYSDPIATLTVSIDRQDDHPS